MTPRCQQAAPGTQPGAATLFLTCGLQAAGKTTLARQLETNRPALRLTSDEWLHQLYPHLSPAELEPFRGTVEAVQWEVAERTLTLGRDVVIDWGLWSRKGRDQLRTRARELGARVVLCLLDPPREVLWNRLAQRNAHLPAGVFANTEADLDRAIRIFERPAAEELALFDSPQAQAGHADRGEGG
jgi:predicted kinase